MRLGFGELLLQGTGVIHGAQDDAPGHLGVSGDLRLSGFALTPEEQGEESYVHVLLPTGQLSASDLACPSLKGQGWTLRSPTPFGSNTCDAGRLCQSVTLFMQMQGLTVSQVLLKPPPS